MTGTFVKTVDIRRNISSNLNLTFPITSLGAIIIPAKQLPNIRIYKPYCWNIVVSKFIHLRQPGLLFMRHCMCSQHHVDSSLGFDLVHSANRADALPMGHLIALQRCPLCMTVGVVSLQSNDMATAGASDFVLNMKWRIFNHVLHPSIFYPQENNKKALNYIWM